MASRRTLSETRHYATEDRHGRRSGRARILIEPHLERRWNMEGDDKLRFAGCQAARHDDHLHVDSGNAAPCPLHRNRLAR